MLEFPQVWGATPPSTNSCPSTNIARYIVLGEEFDVAGKVGKKYTRGSCFAGDLNGSTFLLSVKCMCCKLQFKKSNFRQLISYSPGKIVHIYTFWSSI